MENLKFVGSMVLGAGLLAIGSPAEAQACPNPIIAEQLELQRRALDGDGQPLVDLVQNLNRAQIGVAQGEDKYIFLCNTALFSVARVSSLLAQLEEFDNSSQSSAQVSVRRIKFLAEINSVYQDLSEVYELAGILDDPTNAATRVVRQASLDSFRRIAERHADSIIMPMTSRKEADSTFRVFYGDADDLNLFEAFYDSESDQIVEQDVRISERTGFFQRLDTFKLPEQSIDSWANWARDRSIKLEPARNHAIVVDGVVELPIIWKSTTDIERRQTSVDAILKALFHFRERNPAVFDDGNVTVPDDPEAQEQTISEISVGSCVTYKTPKDDDLFAYWEPDIGSSDEPIKVPGELLMQPFEVLDPPRKATPQDLTRSFEGQVYHNGHVVNEWITLSFRGRPFNFVFSKSTNRADYYVRFTPGECSE